MNNAATPENNFRGLKWLLIFSAGALMLITFTGVRVALGRLNTRSTEQNKLGWTTIGDYSTSSLAIDERGRVWVGSMTFGMGVFDSDHTWTLYTPENSGIADDWVGAITVDEKGRLWAGTFDGTISMLDVTGEWTTYPLNFPAEDKRVWDIAVDKTDRVWLATNSGLYVLQPDGNWTNYTSDNSDLPANVTSDLVVDSQNRVWAATKKGVSVMNPNGDWTIFDPGNSELGAYDLGAITVDGSDQIWVGDSFGGLISVLDSNNHWQNYSIDTKDPCCINYLNSIAVDGHGRVWVGTSQGLSVRAPNGMWSLYDYTNSAIGKYQAASDIAIDKNNRVWVASDSVIAFDPPTISEAETLRTSSDSIQSLSQIYAWLGVLAVILIPLTTALLVTYLTYDKRGSQVFFGFVGWFIVTSVLSGGAHLLKIDFIIDFIGFNGILLAALNLIQIVVLIIAAFFRRLRWNILGAFLALFVNIICLVLLEPGLIYNGYSTILALGFPFYMWFIL